MNGFKTWYAVTNENECTYEWGNGSYDYDEAVEMLKEQGEGELVEVQETFLNGKMINNCAVNRYEYNGIF